MSNRITFDIAGTTGQTPETTQAADAGEMAVNIVDRKVYVRDSAGAALAVADKILPHSASRAYKQYDLVVNGTQFLQCISDIPAKAFDAGDWTVLSPPGDPGSGNILQVPASIQHNTINLTSVPTYEGLRITPDAAQGANLFLAGGEGPSGDPRSVIDAQGFPSATLSGAIFKVSQISHGFGSRGTPVAHDGNVYLKAISTLLSTRKVVGIVEEVIDSNNFVIRVAGRCDQLQGSAFPGGTISPNTTYYISDIEGELTLTPPNTGDTVAILHTTGEVDAGVVLPTNFGTSQYVLRSGDQMSGGLSFGSASVNGDLVLGRHIDLYGGEYGLNVRNNRMNLVAGGGTEEIRMKAALVNYGGADASGIGTLTVDTQTNLTALSVTGLAAFTGSVTLPWDTGVEGQLRFTQVQDDDDFSGIVWDGTQFLALGNDTDPKGATFPADGSANFRAKNLHASANIYSASDIREGGVWLREKYARLGVANAFTQGATFGGTVEASHLHTTTGGNSGDPAVHIGTGQANRSYFYLDSNFRLSVSETVDSGGSRSKIAQFDSNLEREGTLTVITQERGDARYLKSSEQVGFAVDAHWRTSNIAADTWFQPGQLQQFSISALGSVDVFQADNNAGSGEIRIGRLTDNSSWGQVSVMMSPDKWYRWTAASSEAERRVFY